MEIFEYYKILRFGLLLILAKKNDLQYNYSITWTAISLKRFWFLLDDQDKSLVFIGGSYLFILIFLIHPRYLQELLVVLFSLFLFLFERCGNDIHTLGRLLDLVICDFGNSEANRLTRVTFRSSSDFLEASNLAGRRYIGMCDRGEMVR